MSSSPKPTYLKQGPTYGGNTIPGPAQGFAVEDALFSARGQALFRSAAAGSQSFDEYVSDPAKPVARRSGLETPSDENTRPGAPNDPDSGFENTDVKGSRTSSALNIGSKRNEQPPEYKMSGK